MIKNLDDNIDISNDVPNYNMFLNYRKKVCNKILISRTSKKMKFVNEREEIFNKMRKILGIEQCDNVLQFYLYDIECDKNKIDDIINMKDVIGKYFTSKHNIIFRRPEETKKGHTSLVRLVFKEFNYDIFTTNRIIKRNGKNIKTMLYVLVKK